MQYILGEEDLQKTTDPGTLAKERWTSLLPKLNRQLKLEAANSQLVAAMKSVGFSEGDEDTLTCSGNLVHVIGLLPYVLWDSRTEADIHIS